MKTSIEFSHTLFFEGSSEDVEVDAEVDLLNETVRFNSIACDRPIDDHAKLRLARVAVEYAQEMWATQ